MPRKSKPKVGLEKIAEDLKITALRLRLEIPSRSAARKEALLELLRAKQELQFEIDKITR